MYTYSFTIGHDLSSPMDVLLAQIVTDQLETGHFEVVKPVLDFATHLPKTSLTRTVRACAIVKAIEKTLVPEQVAVIQEGCRPAVSVGTSTRLVSLFIDVLQGFMTAYPNGATHDIEVTEQATNLALNMIELAKVLQLDKDFVDILTSCFTMLCGQLDKSKELNGER